MKKQKGMTFLGLIIVAAAVIFVAMIVMKVTPAYIEFMSVKKVLTKVAKDAGPGASKKDIQDAFDRSASIDYITTVNSSDLEISSGNGGTQVSIDYQVKKPIIGNITVLLDFNASASSN